MISESDLLFVEPQGKASPSALIDDLTRQMTAAYRAAQPSSYSFAGVHQCVCGCTSTSCDYFLPDGQKTNSLCVHYLAHHRREVPAPQLARVAALSYGKSDPTGEELQGRRWSGNRPGDFFGAGRLAAIAAAGLDLTAAYLAAEVAPQAHEYFHHVLAILRQMPLKTIPTLIEAIRRADGEVSQWVTRAFWPDGWKETWIAPLLSVLQCTDNETRLWAVHSLGKIGDTQTKWITLSVDGPKELRASGFSSAQGSEVGAALLLVMRHDPEEMVRTAARGAVEIIGSAGEAAVADLVEIVRRSSHKEDRVAAIRALANMGPQAGGASFLLDLLTDPDGQIPWRVLEAITDRKDWIPQILRVLTAALKDERMKIRSNAIAMLRRLGAEALPALPAVKETLADEDVHVRSHAEEAIRSMESWRSRLASG